MRNAVCLCAKDHFRIDKNPDEFMALVHETIGLEAFHALKQKAIQGVGTKVDWELPSWSVSKRSGCG